MLYVFWNEIFLKYLETLFRIKYGKPYFLKILSVS
jgi:hypothetical protein